MQQRFDKSVGGLVIVGLPLLVVAGCAANKATLAQIDSQTPQVETQVKALLDQAAVPATDSTPSSSAQLASDEMTADNATDAPQGEETAASPEAKAPVSSESASAASPETGVPASSETEATAQSTTTAITAGTEPSPDEVQTPAKTVAPLPQQMILYFGFNQDQISPADRAIVKQHADFLLAHPEYTLLITGHTDNRGPKGYNQRLSEARASKVAQLLEADGVPKSQLRISALGDTVPMVDPTDYRHNRRVATPRQHANISTAMKIE
ncbi:MAG: OmpA family protein [Gammaproteobacteria bacterium]